MTIHDRVKQIRQSTGLSQVKFAERLAVSSSYIADFELARKPIKERIIRLICTEFNVDERWFRTGEGEMYSDFSAVRLAEMTSLFKALPPKPQELAISLLSTLVEHHNAAND